MKKQFQKSFTLIEVLVYIAILSIIIVAISAFVLWSTHSTAKAKVMRETLYNVRRALEIMTYEIKIAKSISPTSNINHLILENNTTTEFYLCGVDSTTLCQKKGAETPIFLTSDKIEVNNLEFLQIATSTPSIQISLKVDYKNPTNRPEYEASVNVTSTAALRSY